MTVISILTFVAALAFYGAASVLFFLEVAPHKGPARPSQPGGGLRPEPPSSAARLAPKLLGAGAFGHAVYVTLASAVVHVCPVHSIHFTLSLLSITAIALYLAFRTRLRIHALGLLVSPWPITLALPLLTAPMAMPLLRTVRGFDEPRQLNAVLKGTARLALAFSLLFAAGLALGVVNVGGPLT